MDASESSYCSFCKHTRPIDEFGVKQNGRRMKLCKRCSEYHQTRRLCIAAAKEVAKAESSALALSGLRQAPGKVFLVQLLRRFPLDASRTAIETPSRCLTTRRRVRGRKATPECLCILREGLPGTYTWGLLSIGACRNKPPPIQVWSR